MRPAPAMTVTRLLILATLSSLVSCQTPAQAGGGESFISDIPEVRSRAQNFQSNNIFTSLIIHQIRMRMGM